MLYTNKTRKYIKLFSTGAFSTLYTQNPKLSKVGKVEKASILNNYRICQIVPSSKKEGLFVVGVSRAFHKSAIVNGKITDFIKNLIRKNKDEESISDDTSFEGLRDRGLFGFGSSYNQINNRRINKWRKEVDKSMQTEAAPKNAEPEVSSNILKQEDKNNNNSNNNNNINNNNHDNPTINTKPNPADNTLPPSDEDGVKFWDLWKDFWDD